MIMSKDDFSRLVEEAVSSDGVSYMDAIVMCAGQTGIEVEDAAKLCSKTVKQMLQAESEELNLMEKASSRLPI